MKKVTNFNFRSLIVLSGYTLVLLLLFSWSAFPQHTLMSIKKTLQEAEKYYKSGDFDKAKKRLSELTGAEKLNPKYRAQAYKLLSNVYIAQSLLEKARESLKTMLMLYPEIKLEQDKESPPVYILYKEVRKELDSEAGQSEKARQAANPLINRSPKKGSKKWLWISVGGVAAAGTAAALLLSGGKDKGNGGGNGEVFLPAPPGYPPR